MCCPAFVYIDLKARILPYERSRGCGMIQMDMRKENGAEVGDTGTLLLQLSTEGVEGRSRPWIDQGRKLLRAQKGAGNRTRMSGPLKVDRGNELHRERQCNAGPRESGNSIGARAWF